MLPTNSRESLVSTRANQDQNMKSTVNVPTRGLIRSEPLGKILSGEKTMELRSKVNRQAGAIALIQKGSGQIFGVAEIGESVGPMEFSEFAARANEHAAVEAERLREVYDSGYTIGWRLRNVKRLQRPVTYTHKPGAVTWATLDAAAIDSLTLTLNL
jgi:hypothetical protein